jgi:NADH:ubiquinone oxidoreductase subunit F (NADH-binding)
MTRTLEHQGTRRRRTAVGPEGVSRLLAGWYDERAPAALADHVARFGDMPDRRGDWLIPELEASGLAGRGGAGFPTHRKLRAVLGARRRPIVVANGMEGEPASVKDRFLLSVAPHLVLDGAVLAARAVGADTVHVCIPRGPRSSRPALEHAIDERQLLRGDGPRIQLWTLPPRYVAGEETAVVNWLNGGDARPTTTPPRPFERGVAGRPTLLQNVETLAHLALIARFGAAWFRETGTAAEPGSMLVSISRPDERTAVLETSLGTPIGRVLSTCGVTAEPAAVLVGGYFGSWLAFDDVVHLPLTQMDVRAAGGALGAGILAVLPHGACGLCETARVARYLADQSARQCGPCELGLPAVARDLALVCHGRDPEARSRALRRMGQIEGRGACRHPDGAIRLVRSALAVFAEHVEWHERHGPCPGMYRAPLLPIGPRTGDGEDWR